MKSSKHILVPKKKLRKDAVIQTYYVNPNKKNKSKINKQKEIDRFSSEIEHMKELYYPWEEFDVDAFKKNILKSIENNDISLDEFKNMNDFLEFHREVGNYLYDENGIEYFVKFTNDATQDDRLFDMIHEIGTGKYKNNEIYKNAYDTFNKLWEGKSFSTKPIEANKDLQHIFSMSLWVFQTNFGNALNGLQFKIMEEFAEKSPNIAKIMKKHNAMLLVDYNGVSPALDMTKHSEFFYRFLYEKKAFEDSFKNALNNNNDIALKHYKLLRDNVEIKDINAFLNDLNLPYLVNNEQKKKLLDLMSKENKIKEEGFYNAIPSVVEDIRNELVNILKNIKREKTIFATRRQFAEPFLGPDNLHLLKDEEKLKKFLNGKVVMAGYQSTSPYKLYEYDNTGHFRLFFTIDNKKLKNYLTNNVSLFKFDWASGINEIGKSFQNLFGNTHESEIIMKNYWKIYKVEKSKGYTTADYDVYLINISKDEFLKNIKNRKRKKK